MKRDQVVQGGAVVKLDRIGAVLDELLAQQISLPVGQGAHLGAHPGRRDGADRHHRRLEGKLAELDPDVLERQPRPQLLVVGAGRKGENRATKD